MWWKKNMEALDWSRFSDILIEDEEGTTPTSGVEDLAPNQEVTLDLGDGLEIEIEE